MSNYQVDIPSKQTNNYGGQQNEKKKTVGLRQSPSKKYLEMW
jgi:hypothetical protein